jgi:hypothetical protein
MFATPKKGRVAERLGRGLQNLVQRFDSALDLRKSLRNAEGFLLVPAVGKNHAL